MEKKRNTNVNDNIEKAKGDTLEEKIENAEEEINDQFRGNDRRRA